VYCRVSTEGQRDNYSLDDQKRIGTAFLSQIDAQSIVLTEVKSAVNAKSREEWQKAYKLLETDQAEGLWVLDQDRLARDEEDSAHIWNMLSLLDKKLYIHHKEINLNNEDDQLAYGIMSNISAYNRRKIGKKSRIGRRSEIDAGNLVVSRIYGYNYVYDPEGNLRILINETEAECIRIIYGDFLTHGTIYHAAKMVASLGYKPRWGMQVWTLTQTKCLLEQCLYTGLQRNTKGELIKSNKYPKIIDRDSWHSVQKMVKAISFSRQGVSDFVISKHPLSGIIRCECGVKWYRTNCNAHNPISTYKHQINSGGDLLCRYWGARSKPNTSKPLSLAVCSKSSTTPLIGIPGYPRQRNETWRRF
jgi:DNA invertase Pin-like site-specific DNA recombinase